MNSYTNKMCLLIQVTEPNLAVPGGSIKVPVGQEALIKGDDVSRSVLRGIHGELRSSVNIVLA